MFRPARRFHALTAFVAALAVLPATGGAQEKPALADTLRVVLDRDGADAGRKRFAEIYPEHASEYRVDMMEMVALGSSYMQAGDAVRARAVMEMVSTLATASDPAASAGTPAAATSSSAERTTAETDGQRYERLAHGGGAPLSDAVSERYEGVYRDPAETDATRRFFLVRDPCGPQMMFGAMWADAENIYLRIASDDVLVQPAEGARNGAPIRIEVERDAAGRATRLSHNSPWAASPLVRQEDLPAEWRGARCTGG